MLLLLLLLIPIFCMGVSVYIATLYQYVVDKLNVLPLTISIFVIVVIGYILPRLFYNLYKSDTPGSLNAEKKVYNLSNYISYIVLLFFATALCAKFIINRDSYLDIYVALIIIFVFMYITYVYYLDYKNVEFKVNDIVEKNKKTSTMYLENKEYGVKEVYIDPNSEYKIGEKYTFKYNKNSDLFKLKKNKKKKDKK